MMAKLFITLYPLAGLSYILGYIPQIIKLIQADRPPRNLSMGSWFIWIGGNILTIGYGHYHLTDFMLVLTSVLCLGLSVAVIGLSYYNAHFRFKI